MMTLQDVWKRLYRNNDPEIEFEEFEELLNDWAWNEYNRQRSVAGVQDASDENTDSVA